MNYIGNIGPQIDVKLFNLGLNNEQIAEEILSSKTQRINNDPISSGYEDTYFYPSPNSESEKFVEIIKDFFQSDFTLGSIWSHIHHPLESTNTHNHGIYGMSFVYYVKVPVNSGIFTLDFSLSNGFRHPIKPYEGMFLLFPTWVPHMVTKNLSKDIRISISGNFIFKNNDLK